MDFYVRYAQICSERGIDPCSQKAAELFGVTRATISTWNKKGSAPKGETVKMIADALEVSADYLLGRTDDPTDYTNRDLIASVAGPVLDHFDGDVKKALAFKAAVDANALEKNQTPKITKLYNMLDDEDRIKVEGVIQGLLLADKYKNQQQNLA